MGPEDRQREFRQLLTNGFHLDLIGRFVLGRHWRRASDQERAEFQRLFEDYVVASYSRQLSNYAGERLVIEGGRAQGDRGALVSSQITRRQGEPLHVEWRLRRVGDGWKIIDVVVEGISMAVTHRSEFSSVIGSHGGRIDGLLEVLRDKTAPAETHASAGGVGTL
jgi:phospholipid transport system substrate-binding protein